MREFFCSENFLFAKYGPNYIQDNLLFIDKQFDAILLYCIYKIYIYYKVERTLYLLSGDQCCDADNPHSIRTCKKRNCSHKVKSTIISKISKVNRSIDIAMFQLTNDDITDALLIAHQIRMVKVRIIVDKSMFNKDGSPKEAIAKLLARGNILLLLVRNLKLCKKNIVPTLRRNSDITFIFCHIISGIHTRRKCTVHF